MTVQGTCDTPAPAQDSPVAAAPVVAQPQATTTRRVVTQAAPVAQTTPQQVAPTPAFTPPVQQQPATTAAPVQNAPVATAAPVVAAQSQQNVNAAPVAQTTAAPVAQAANGGNAAAPATAANNGAGNAAGTTTAAVVPNRQSRSISHHSRLARRDGADEDRRSDDTSLVDRKRATRRVDCDSRRCGCPRLRVLPRTCCLGPRERRHHHLCQRSRSDRHPLRTFSRFCRCFIPLLPPRRRGQHDRCARSRWHQCSRDGHRHDGGRCIIELWHVERRDDWVTCQRQGEQQVDRRHRCRSRRWRAGSGWIYLCRRSSTKEKERCWYVLPPLADSAD